MICTNPGTPAPRLTFCPSTFSRRLSWARPDSPWPSRSLVAVPARRLRGGYCRSVGLAVPGHGRGAGQRARAVSRRRLQPNADGGDGHDGAHRGHVHHGGLLRPLCGARSGRRKGGDPGPGQARRCGHDHAGREVQGAKRRREPLTARTDLESSATRERGFKSEGEGPITRSVSNNSLRLSGPNPQT